VAPATNKITNMTRGVASTVAATARQVPKRRIVVMAAAGALLVTLALLVRLPIAVQLRDWATSVGPWLPLAFLPAHIVVTVLPFPRTAFTLAAGLLFGPVLGVTLAVASTASALIALMLVPWSLTIGSPPITTLAGFWPVIPLRRKTLCDDRDQPGQPTHRQLSESSRDVLKIMAIPTTRTTP
jgi:hypothetical protein